MKRTLGRPALARPVFGLAALSLALIAPPLPAAAQEASERSWDQSGDAAAMGEMFASMFTSEPLTPEQEARLPAAKAIVDTMMPPGFYGEMMSEAMAGSLKPIMAMFNGATGADMLLGSRLDVDPATRDALSDEEKIELANLLDPAFDQRGAIMPELMNAIMRDVAVAIEPGFREGMAKAYAVRFDERQLADIAAFFATPTGAVYATENLKLMTDPQVMSASMQAMPQMMNQLGGIEAQIREAMEALPPERAIEELSDEQRARAAAILGVDAAALSQYIKPPGNSRP